MPVKPLDGFDNIFIGGANGSTVGNHFAIGIYGNVNISIGSFRHWRSYQVIFRISRPSGEECTHITGEGAIISTAHIVDHLGTKLFRILRAEFGIKQTFGIPFSHFSNKVFELGVVCTVLDLSILNIKVCAGNQAICYRKIVQTLRGFFKTHADKALIFQAVAIHIHILESFQHGVPLINSFRYRKSGAIQPVLTNGKTGIGASDRIHTNRREHKDATVIGRNLFQQSGGFLNQLFEIGSILFDVRIQGDNQTIIQQLFGTTTCMDMGIPHDIFSVAGTEHKVHFLLGIRIGFFTPFNMNTSQLFCFLMDCHFGIAFHLAGNDRLRHSKERQLKTVGADGQSDFFRRGIGQSHIFRESLVAGIRTSDTGATSAAAGGQGTAQDSCRHQ